MQKQPIFPLICNPEKRKVKRFVFVLLFVVPALAATAQGTVTFRGQIKNSSYDSIFVNYNNSRLIYDPVEYKAQLQDSSFEYTFKVKEEYTPITFSHGKHSGELLVKAGDELDMTAMVTDSNWRISFKGPGSDRANWLAKHAKDMGQVEKYPHKMQRYLTGKPETFIKNMKMEQLKEMVYLENNKAGLPADFIDYLAACYNYFTYFCLYQYPYLHEVAQNKTRNLTEIPKENYRAVADIPAEFNDKYIGMIPYRLYIDQIYRMKLEVAGYFNDTINIFRVQDSIGRMALRTMPPASAEYVIATHLYAAIRHLPLDTAIERTNRFKKRWPESIYKKDLESQLAIAKRLAPGEKAYDFTFTTPQGKTGKLSDLKGKYVLLGFWSSEYRQSIIEMKAAVQLGNKYKDKNIEFLYVSLDSDDLPRIMAIETNKLAGIHSRESGGWKSLLAQIYGVQSLPVFFLIDKEGKFALKLTPLPSQAAAMVRELDKVLTDK